MEKNTKGARERQEEPWGVGECRAEFAACRRAGLWPGSPAHPARQPPPLTHGAELTAQDACPETCLLPGADS